MAVGSETSSATRWFGRFATAIFGAAIAVGGLALDKRAEDRRQIEVIVEFYEHCYGTTEQRRAAARALEFFRVGESESDLFDPLMRQVDGLVGGAAVDGRQLIDELLRDENGCGGDILAIAEAPEDAIFEEAIVEPGLGDLAEAPAPPPAITQEVIEQAQQKAVVQQPEAVASAQSLDRRAIRAARAYTEVGAENVGKIRQLFFPRLFVQTTDQTDMGLLDELRFALSRGLRVDGESVEIAPETHVGGADVAGVQLRFLKRADEAEAQLIAAQRETVMGGPVRVGDLSATYESNARVRPRTFELWLGGL